MIKRELAPPECLPVEFIEGLRHTQADVSHAMTVVAQGM
jgi:hypothetical protein